MSEEKLDLILTVVSDIKGRMGKLENEFGSFKIEVNTRFDSLENELKDVKGEFKDFKGEFKDFKGEFKDFKGEFNEFKGEFKDFKKQTIQAYKSLNGRIDILEKQMLAIGMELKDEIRHEIADVRKEISRLESKIMLEQAEKFENKSEQLKQEVVVRELAERVKNIEVNLKEVNLKLAA